MFIFLSRISNKQIFFSTAFLLLLLIVPAMATAQQDQKDKIITLSPGNIRLDSLGARINHQCGLVLAFNARSIRPASHIQLQKAQISLSDLLEYLKNTYGFSYRILGNHIILSRMQPAKLPVPEARLPPQNGQVAATHRAPGPGARAHMRNEESHEKKTERPDKPLYTLFQITALSRNRKETELPALFAQSAITVPAVIHDSDRKIPVQQIPVQPAARQPVNIHGAKRRLDAAEDRLLFSAGFTADESFYLTPTLKAGLSWLYLSGTWRTNFDVSGFSYGIGGSFKISETWKAQISVSRGALTNRFSLDSLTASSSLQDTIHIQVKGSLTQAALLAEKKINNRISLQFGPVLDLLKYRIYSGGKPVSEMSSFPDNIDVNKKYYLLRPPYTLQASYSTTSSSGKKMWIGLQAGIFYRF